MSSHIGTLRGEPEHLPREDAADISSHVERGVSIAKNRRAKSCAAPDLAPSVRSGGSVGEFQLDPDLHDTLRGIRESIRQLFEQLRLRDQDGDLSGKDRLERVPALAKRNFANLSGAHPLRAVKEAWRLIDFLEGGDQARLSPLARDGLRVVELDRKIADLRESDSWKEAAARLRQALGLEGGAVEAAREPAEEAGGFASDLASPAPGPISETAMTDQPLLQVSKRRAHRSRWASFTAVPAVAVLAVAGGLWWSRKGKDNPTACAAVESSSAEALARHRAPNFGEALPRPPRTEPAPRIIRISDSADGRSVRSTWTTSQFSYAERDGPQRPGGGKSDYRLRIGGWGDTYVSLLQVPVPSDRLANRAVLQLTVLGDEKSSRPTSMTLRAIRDHWTVGPGPDDRLWWRDCPGSEAVANHLPPPGRRGSVYEIDITDLYNQWVVGFRPPYGVMLEPEQIGSWKTGRPQYPNYNTFYSTRARDPENRPRLVLNF
jgi:hypothetical protein